ncbi:kinase-like protein [Apiospora marii]|uniref:kinase-like protein n=1 Tax=Apiospora marii TaxID=335849 RepID=UPI003130B41D
MSTTPSPTETGSAPAEKPSWTTPDDEEVQKYIPKYEVVGDWEYEVEDAELYEPGGLDPILLYTTIGDRFEFIHKLGHGGYSTVWLARDREQNRWRALKIVVSSHSSEDSGELLAKRLLGENGIGLEEAVAHHILLPEEHFYIEGPNGRHLVLVLPLLGPTLPQWLEFNEHKDDVKRKLCRQMIEAIEFLQSQGLCHGDFRPRNMLMKLRNVDHFTEEEIREALGGAPTRYRIQTLAGGDPGPHAPDYAIGPGKWSITDKDHLIQEDLVVTDFGEAFVPGGHKNSRYAIPRAHAAPEVTFTSEPGLPSDIWSLGVAIMAVLGTDPFLNDIRSTVMALERYLGPLPLRYRTDFEKQQNKHLLACYNYTRSRWQDFILMEKVSPEDRPELGVFSLTESQKNDPSHPAAYESVAALEEARDAERGGYAHPISDILGCGKEVFFEKTDPRYNPEITGHYEMPREEADLLTDLALKIFLLISPI